MPLESAYVRNAKLKKHAEVVADANDLKAQSKDYSVKAVRRAERDAMRELAAEYDDPDEVHAIALPSERLSDE